MNNALRFINENTSTLFPIVCIALGVVTIVCIISLILLIITMVRLDKMRKNYRIFMNGKTAENLEDSMLSHFKKIDDLIVLSKKHGDEIDKINDQFKTTFSKMGIVKYDAFNEMGGKLSFALALLDNNNSGYVINAMHSREGCYTYIKEIIKGESFIVLAEEEKQAINKAMGIE